MQAQQDEENGIRGFGGCMFMVALLVIWIAIIGLHGWYGLLFGGVLLAVGFGSRAMGWWKTRFD